MRRIVLIVIIVLQSACTGSLLHHEKLVFRCSYRNVSTKKMYISTSHDHFTALSRAQKACKKDPVEWRCYFDSCIEIPLTSTNHIR